MFKNTLAALAELRWKWYKFKNDKILIWGFKKRLITLYSEGFIRKARNVYYGGVPASVLLLSDGMSNGRCYDRALLVSKIFLDEPGDVRMIYALVDGLRLNPKLIDKKDPLYADHCIVERITKKGRHIIYDTSSGFVWDKRLYWLLEHPKVRKVNDKAAIAEFIKYEDSRNPNGTGDSFASLFVLPVIEKSYSKPNEAYALEGIELLQREVEHYKKVIGYDNLRKEVEAHIASEEISLGFS